MPARRKSDKECVIEGCSRERKNRGLCEPCYQAARRQVLAGEVTWEQLEKAGLAIEKGAIPKSNANAAAVAIATMQQQTDANQSA